ncbi:unnamed protein product [Amoebophrya sp. A25]|nr:unnamed protein product [Amoebophrya sp. A25]|eukprot:GSA25T00014291001.1
MASPERARVSARGASAARVTVNLLATGRQHEIDTFPDSQTIGDLKTLIERQCAIDREEMRLMHNGRSLTVSMDQILLSAAGIADGAQLVVMIRLNVYNEVAGQTRIDGAAKDNYGNAAGNNFDLARDGAFKGAQILVLHLYTFGGFDFRFPQSALEQKGFRIKRFTAVPDTEVLRSELADCCQLWMISSIEGRLLEPHMAVIKEFWYKGNGVYIWGENKPCYEDANRLGKYLIGATMSGNVPGGKVVRERPLVATRGATASEGPGFVQHLITTGLETLFEGVTVATIHQDRNFHRQKMKPLVYGSDMISGPGGVPQPNLVTAVYEQDGRRLIIDTGFTRLYVNWDSAGTGRYVSNAAAWLANFERFQQYAHPDLNLMGLHLAREEIEELRDAFELFDKSKTGYINFDDLQSVLLSLGQHADAEEISDMLATVQESNPDAEMINFREFLGIINGAVEDANVEQEIYEAFVMFDSEENNFISANELKIVMDSLGTRVSHQDVQEMITEADLNGERRINYDEFFKIMTTGTGGGTTNGKNGTTGGKKNVVSKQEKERLEDKAERRHGRGQRARMAHLRAAQRWDALRTQVMKAVRRRRVENQEKVTSDNNAALDHQRIRHLLGLMVTTVITTVCIVVPLVLQAQFKSQMSKAQDLRELAHAGKMVQYYDEALTMSARMTAITAAQEMTDSAHISGSSNRCDLSGVSDYLCCTRWVARYNQFVPLMDAAIATIDAKASDIAKSYGLAVKDPNAKLIARETVALNMCGGTGAPGSAGTGVRSASSGGMLSVNPDATAQAMSAGYASVTGLSLSGPSTTTVLPGGTNTPGRGLLNGIDALFDEGMYVKQTTGANINVLTDRTGASYVRREFLADEVVSTSTSSDGTVTDVQFKFAGAPQVDLQRVISGAHLGVTWRVKRVYENTLTQWLGIIEGDTTMGEYRPWLARIAQGTTTKLDPIGTFNPTTSFSDFSTALSGVSSSSGNVTISVVDPMTATSYDSEKGNLMGAVRRLEDLIEERVADFDRDHWSSAMRNGMVLVVCAICQGFAVFLLILQEKRLVLMEYKLSKSEDQCQDLKQRDWLTSEALPVLRATIVEDIQRSWYNYRASIENSLSPSKGQRSAGGGATDEHEQTDAVENSSTAPGPPSPDRRIPPQVVAAEPPLQRTESQKLRMTAIWTNKFKKIARLQKLQMYMSELDDVTAKLRPFKKYQFRLMIVAELVCLICILVPSMFEIVNNESIRATAELRNLQEAGDLVQYYDEALTMSARMAVLRGDKGGWSRRYSSFVGPMDVMLGSPPDVVPSFKGRIEIIEDVLLNQFGTGHDEESTVGNIWDSFSTAIVTANAALVGLETAALDAAAFKDATAPSTEATRYQNGKAGLFDATYEGHKTTLSNAIVNTLTGKIAALVTYQQNSDDDRLDLNEVIIGLVITFLVIILFVIGYYEYRLITLEKLFLETYRNVMKYEQRDWLTNDALLTLRTNIISDVRRATLRRYEEAEDERKPFIEVMQKPKDLAIADVPVTASTMRFMEHA